MTELIQETADDIQYLESISNALDIALSEADLAQIKEELMQSGYIRRKHTKKKVKLTSKPMHYISSDGYDMYVGKNNLQNEELTFSFANGNDWWFHAKGAPGSHVIVKSGGDELPDRTFEEAARLAGINVNKLTVLVYSFAGFAASIAAIIMVARTNASQPGAGSSYAFDCMTAACLGGVSIAGGEGKISGTVVGVIILGILDNGLVLMGVNSNFQSVIKGLILLLAVAIDCYQGGQKRKKA